jgi:hypothetical protein
MALNRIPNEIEDHCAYISPGTSVPGDNMGETLKTLAGATIIAAACQAGISLPPFFGLFRALKVGLDRVNVSAPALIERMVDWLEAAYGGPIDSY